MDEDSINDLKQFIATTVRHETAEIKEQIVKLDKKIDTKIDEAKEEILSAVSDVTSPRFDSVEEDLKDHEVRLTKLEHGAA
jgi:uncharacterized coiled-coil DUF342 family protein